MWYARILVKTFVADNNNVLMDFDCSWYMNAPILKQSSWKNVNVVPLFKSSDRAFQNGSYTL